MKDQLRAIITRTFEQCRAEGLLRSETLPNFTVELPRSKQHGDLATNIAMLLAKQEKRAPREIADIFIGKLVAADACILKAEIAGPGFINCFIDASVWHDVLQQIEQQAERYGSVDIGQGAKVMVEFVSHRRPSDFLAFNEHPGPGRGRLDFENTAQAAAKRYYK